MPGQINPLLLEIPDHFETERLLLRAPRVEDAPTLYEAIRESQDELSRWLPWAYEIPTLNRIKEVLRQAAAAFILREDFMLLLFHWESGVFIGASGLHKVDWSIPQFEMGYWLRMSVQGQGYMTEAVDGITRFAFRDLGAERVEIRVDPRNKRSLAVAERSGYVLEGTLRRIWRTKNGDLTDMHIYSKIRGEDSDGREDPRIEDGDDR
jgi:RimJ/RimL family protein N-acetyltransferase